MMRRRFIAASAAGAVRTLAVAGAAGAAAPVPAAPSNASGAPAALESADASFAPARSPIVLVHGAWHGGWCWQRVLPHLAAAGHAVFTPTLTGLGERSHLTRPDIDLELHARDLESVLEMEDPRTGCATTRRGSSANSRPGMTR